MLESKFEKKCIIELRKLPYSYWPDKVDSPTIRGIPDRVGCVMGVYCALEFKRNKTEARKQTGRTVLQRKTLRDIHAAGGFAAFVYPENWDHVLNKIKAIIALGGTKNENNVHGERKRAAKETLI